MIKKTIVSFLLFITICLLLCTVVLSNEDLVNVRIRKDLFIKKPEIIVPVNIIVEENSQRQVDGGHSPWRLDLIQSTITFVSLKISPEGVHGPFPVKEKDIHVLQESQVVAIVELVGDYPVKRVYFQRLIRQDSTGIWTVVGYDER